MHGSGQVVRASRGRLQGGVRGVGGIRARVCAIQDINGLCQEQRGRHCELSDQEHSKDEEETITLETKFPQGATHYMILNNIEPFKSIEIYGMKFRTDPRFETYNSSGYVYNARTKTLFLKYRHKSETEIVKLIYKEEVVPEVTETTETTSSSETSPEATNSDETPSV